jgi:hypothetical protein
LKAGSTTSVVYLSWPDWSCQAIGLRSTLTDAPTDAASRRATE